MSSFARADRELLPTKTPPTQSPTAAKAFRDGTEKLKNGAQAIADDERVQAAVRATKEKAEEVANFFGVGNGTPPAIESAQLQGQKGGKRRRKSRRKKRRTKRRRKSRRKKRRTKRRRKSRRKRRR